MKSSFLFASLSILLFVAAPSIAAETAPQAQGAKRTILQRTDVPGSNYEVVMVLVEVPPNTKVGRHTHPGTVVGYLLEGEYTMLVDGKPPLALKPNDVLQVPSGAVHDEHSGAQPAKLIAVFTVEKGKPLTTPAP